MNPPEINGRESIKVSIYKQDVAEVDSVRLRPRDRRCEEVV